MAIPSDEDPNSELENNEASKENSEGSARTGRIAQTYSANTSGTQMEADLHLWMEIEKEEQEVEGGETMEVSIPTQEELVMAGASTPTLTPVYTYSTTGILTIPT